MASTIKIKRSAVTGNAPTTSNITTGELALNTADGVLYSSDGSSIFEIGANLSSLSVAGISYPTSDGSSGQVLTTNGSGTLSFTDASGGASEINDLSDGYSDGYSIGLGSNALANDDGTSNSNVAIGLNAAQNLTSGVRNIAIGHEAIGLGVTTGYYNIALGYQAGYDLTSGNYNIALGYQAGYDLTSGGYNVLQGYRAGYNLTTGNFNIAIGYEAIGLGVTTGSGHNIALGYQAGYDLTSGAHNILQGYGAGANITTGFFNIAIGREAIGLGVTTGYDNIALGYQAGNDLTSGGYNVLLGRSAGTNITTGGYNTAIGYQAGDSLTTGSNNIVIGKQAQTTSGTSSNEIILGNTSHDYFSIPGVGFKIDNGNVAIGAASPTAKLDVYSGVLGTSDGDQLEQARFRSTTTNASYLRIFTERDGAGSAWTTAFTRIQQRIDTSDHGYVQFSGADNVAGMSFGIGNNEAMRITSSGNVGIGASPVHELDVVGDGARSVVRANTTASNARLEAQASNYWSGSTYTGTALIQYGSTATGTTAGLSNANLGALSFQNGSGGLIYTNGANPIIFGVTSIERMRIVAGGNVGIGATSPTGLLTLGTTAPRLDFLESDGSAGFDNTILIRDADVFAIQTRNGGTFVSNDYRITTNASGALTHEWRTGNTERMRIHSNGYVGIGTTSPLAPLQAVGTGFNTNGNTYVASAFIQDTSNYRGVYLGYESDEQRGWILGGGTSSNLSLGTYTSGNVPTAAINIDSSGNVGIGTTSPSYKLEVSGSLNTTSLYIGGTQVTSTATELNLLDGITGTVWSSDNDGATSGLDADTLDGQEGSYYLDYNNFTNTPSGGGASEINDLSDGYSDGFSVGLGTNALANDDGSNYNVAIGRNVAQNLTSGTNNIALGYGAIGTGVTTGNHNIALGYQAGDDLTSGLYNIFQGYQAGTNVTTGRNNIFQGFLAGSNVTTSEENIFLGSYAGNIITSGGNYNIALGQYAMGILGGGTSSAGYNIALGYRAGQDLTTGSNNIFQGNESGKNSTTGNYNIALGYWSMSGADTTGSNNIAIGHSTGYDLTTGQYNIFQGQQAGYNVTTGNYNIALGQQAIGTGVTTGDGNIALGLRTGNDLTSGSYNVLLGHNAGQNVTTAYNSVAIGYSTMGTGATTGSENIALGTYAGTDLTSGGYNIFQGYRAGYNATTGSHNIAFGRQAIGSGVTTGNYNIALAYQAGYNLTTGHDNVFLGYYAGRNIATGSYNIGIGQASLGAIGATSGDENIAIGPGSGQDLTSGTNNIFQGYQAGGNVTTGSWNIALGRFAIGLGITTGNYNVVFGVAAGYDLTSGTNNIFQGYEAGYEVTTGSNNIAIGESAIGLGVTTGNHNIALGYRAGYNLTSGANNITIGYQAGDSLTTGYNNIIIGYDADATAVDAANEITLGNASITSFRIPGLALTANTTVLTVTGDITATGTITELFSDERLKTFDGKIYNAIEKINSLNGYYFYENETAKELGYNNPNRQVGLSAQEVEKVLPEIVFDAPINKNKDTDYKTLKYDKMVPLLVEAIKEQQQQIEEQKKQIEELKSLIQRMLK